MIGIALAAVAALAGCGKDEESIVAPEPTPVSVIPTRNVDGTISLPVGFPIPYTDLEIIGATGTTTASSQGAFTVSVPSGFYSFMYVYDKDGKLIAAAYDTMGAQFTVDPLTTAKALVMMFPIDWRKLNLTTEELLEEIEAAPSFAELEGYVENVMINDPENLMDYQAHPTILETAADVINEVIAGKKRTTHNQVLSGARVEDIPGDPNVKVINPKAVPYGICAYNTAGPADNVSSYSFLKTPLYVNGWDFEWWVWPTPGEGEYNLGDGTFMMMLSKMDPVWLSPFLGPTATFQSIMDHIWSLHAGDYLEVLRANARIKGSLGGVLTISYRSLGIISVIDPFELTGVGKIVMEFGPEATELLTDITLAGEAPFSASKETLVKWGAKIVSSDNNSRAIAKFLQKHGAKITAKSLKAAAENLTVVLDVIGAIEDGALLIAFVWDLGTADQDICYFINQVDGDAVDLFESLPPAAPTIYDATTKATVGHTCYFSVVSTDPENDRIQYFMNFGDGVMAASPFMQSGEYHIFSHSWAAEGTYGVYAFAMDEKGVSSQYSDTWNMRIYPAGGFYENFDSYPIGSSDWFGPWMVDFQLPSRVMIVDLMDGSLGRSCKFIDYDPDIGDSDEYYAYIATDVTGDPTQVEFKLRIDEAGDDFGVRTWQSLGNWSSLSYYVIIHADKLRWVKYGYDLEDPSDFIPVMDIVPAQWYNIKLVIDWSGMQYDLYVDNVLKAADCTFIGSVHYATAFQGVAFTTTKCRAAYLDEIRMTGGSIAAKRAKPGSVLGSDVRSITRPRR